jgi:serine/threonine protein kinase
MREENKIHSNEFAIGSVLANCYLIQKELGRGGQGLVLKAADLKNYNNPVVIKTLHDDNPDAWVKKKFEQEKEALAQLQGLNGVVKLIGNGKSESGKDFMVLEFLDGVELASLHQELSQNLQRAARLFRQIAATMNSAHEKGIVHRDLKSINIIVVHAAEFQETAKIIDFGIVKIEQSVLTGNTTKTVIGTPFYLSPNALAGGPEPRADDIYALGMIAYEMVTGTYPISKENMTLDKIREMQRDIHLYPPSGKNPRLSRVVDNEILRALSVDPGQRHATAGELGENLNKALFDLSKMMDATVVDPPTPPPAAVKRFSWVPILGGLMMIVLLLALLGPVVWRAVQKSDEIKENSNSPNSQAPIGPNTAEKRSADNKNATANVSGLSTAPGPAVQENPPGATSPDAVRVDIRKRAGKTGSVPTTTGDVFKTDDGIQFSIQPTEDLFLRVIARDNSGKVGEIYGGRITAGGVYTIPGPQKWIFFDDKPGTETIFLVFHKSDPGKITDAASLESEGKGRTEFTSAKGAGVRVLKLDHVK